MVRRIMRMDKIVLVIFFLIIKRFLMMEILMVKALVQPPNKRLAAAVKMQSVICQTSILFFGFAKEDMATQRAPMAESACARRQIVVMQLPIFFFIISQERRIYFDNIYPLTKIIPGEDDVNKYEALYLDCLLITQAPAIPLVMLRKTWFTQHHMPFNLWWLHTLSLIKVMRNTLARQRSMKQLLTVLMKS